MVVAVSLSSGIVGFLLATKFYVLHEILAGLLSVAILFAAGVLLLVFFVFLREGWQYCIHWPKQVSRLDWVSRYVFFMRRRHSLRRK